MKPTRMTFRHLRWLSPVLAILLISCAPTSLGGLQDDFNTARNQWRSAGFTDYSYHYQSTCFCPREVVLPVIVTVHGDQVTNVIYEETGEPVAPEYLGHFHTIDELFNTVQEAINSQPVEMNMSYDPDYGYPNSAYVDYDEYIADEELRFVASGLQQLSGD